MNWIIAFALVVFGISSWLSISGIYAELPLIVDKVPEKWTVSSYLAIIIQIGNIVPVLYIIGHKYLPAVINERNGIYTILSIGIIGSFLLAFLWNRTEDIGGTEHSIWLFFSTFILSIVDCTSTVTYFPFMSVLSEKYMVPFFIGEGMSGLIPNAVALIQGVGSKQSVTKNGTHTCVQIVPLFTTEIFFTLLAFLMMISLIAFIFIDLQEHSEHARTIDEMNDNLIQDSRAPYVILTATTWLAFMQNGMLKSIQTYTLMPYGNITMILATNLSAMSSPMICLIQLFKQSCNEAHAYILLFLASISALFLMMIGLLSPQPPLHGTKYGSTMIIIAWMLFTATTTLSKLILANACRKIGGMKALRWYGEGTQIGSFFGALLGFILVNQFKIFKSANTTC